MIMITDVYSASLPPLGLECRVEKLGLLAVHGDCGWVYSPAESYPSYVAGRLVSWVGDSSVTCVLTESYCILLLWCLGRSVVAGSLVLYSHWAIHRSGC